MTLVPSTRTISLTFVHVDELRVAMPSARVARVHSASDHDEPGSDSRRIDLGTFLGRGERVRDETEVLFSLDGVSATIVATMPVVVTDVGTETVHPVPEYLASWARARGIVGVVSTDGSLSYLLDPDAFDRSGDAPHLTGTSA